jgi:hypothetical protein
LFHRCDPAGQFPPGTSAEITFELDCRGLLQTGEGDNGKAALMQRLCFYSKQSEDAGWHPLSACNVQVVDKVAVVTVRVNHFTWYGVGWIRPRPSRSGNGYHIVPAGGRQAIMVGNLSDYVLFFSHLPENLTVTTTAVGGDVSLQAPAAFSAKIGISAKRTTVKYPALSLALTPRSGNVAAFTTNNSINSFWCCIPPVPWRAILNRNSAVSTNTNSGNSTNNKSGWYPTAVVPGRDTQRIHIYTLERDSEDHMCLQVLLSTDVEFGQMLIIEQGLFVNFPIKAFALLKYTEGHGVPQSPVLAHCIAMNLLQTEMPKDMLYADKGNLSDAMNALSASVNSSDAVTELDGAESKADANQDAFASDLITTDTTAVSDDAAAVAATATAMDTATGAMLAPVECSCRASGRSE